MGRDWLILGHDNGGVHHMTSTAVATARPPWEARKNRIGRVQTARFRARASEALQPARSIRLAALGGRADNPVGAMFLAGAIGDREVLGAVELERRHWMAARVLGASNRASSGAPPWFAELPRPMGAAARDCVDRYQALTRGLGATCPPLVLRELLGAVLEGLGDGNAGRVLQGLQALAKALEGEAAC